MEKKVETTTMGLYRVQGSGCLQFRVFMEDATVARSGCCCLNSSSMGAFKVVSQRMPYTCYIHILFYNPI